MMKISKMNSEHIGPVTRARAKKKLKGLDT